MDAKLKELQEKKNAAATAIKELGDRQANWTAEDRGQWDTLNAEYDATAAALTARDAELKNAEAVQKRLKEIEDANRQANGDKGGGFDADKRRELDAERTAQRECERRAVAFQGWALAQSGMELRKEHQETCRAFDFNPVSTKAILLGPDGSLHRAIDGTDNCDLPIGTARRRYGEAAWSSGDRQMQREVRVGLDVGTAGAGQETIPTGFMNMLEKKTLAYGSVRQVAKVIQTATGNSLPWPVVDDTGNVAAILAEATTIGTSVDPTFSAVTMVSYKLSSKPVFVSAEILQDSAFNLASELAELMGVRFGRGENVYFTTGTGSQPQGLITQAGTGKTTVAATAFTADELIDLVHSLDPSYRALPSTGFMMKDDVVAYIRKFKDANGAAMWQPGMQLGIPDRIYGYPVIVNQQMTGLTSSLPVSATKHVLFGAFEKYLVRDAGGVRMYHLTERYRDLDQDCFVAFKRVDGRCLNTAAFKVLLQA
jgi:HK97 family phage major capsid protein